MLDARGEAERGETGRRAMARRTQGDSPPTGWAAATQMLIKARVWGANTAQGEHRER